MGQHLEIESNGSHQMCGRALGFNTYTTNSSLVFCPRKQEKASSWHTRWTCESHTHSCSPKCQTKHSGELEDTESGLWRPTMDCHAMLRHYQLPKRCLEPILSAYLKSFLYLIYTSLITREPIRFLITKRLFRCVSFFFNLNQHNVQQLQTVEAVFIFI